MINMNYISAEEFLRQDKEVKRVFLKWWKPSNGDLFWWIEDKLIDCCDNQKMFNNTDIDNLKGIEIIPLLTEGQLRQFIEDKTGGKLQVEYYDTDILIRVKKDRKEIKSYMFYNNNDLLQIYWKVAIEIAKEY